MNALEIIVVCAVVLIAGTTGVRVAWYEVRQARHARHVLREVPADEPPARDFYGSMNLEDEWAHAAPHQDWHTRTMAELSPEALDPGLGGDVSSPDLPPPGPDQDLDGRPTVSHPEGAKGVNAPPVQTGPASLAPVWERLADTGDITAAHATHPHPGEDWLDVQLADLFTWVKTQLEATA